VITGSTYLERGAPVTVVAAWNGAVRDLPDLSALLPHVRTKRTAPRNVMTRDAHGAIKVRPFRGLRTLPEADGGEP
jgi:hypothetical protein